jgi:hypothetical protein
MAVHHQVNIEVLPYQAIDELIAKIQHAAAEPTNAAAVASWLEAHHLSGYENEGHSFCVVGSTMMLLHPCPDGTVLPFAVYPDGKITAYCDPDHAGVSFL